MATKRVYTDPRIRRGWVRVAVQNVRPGEVVRTEDGPRECFGVLHDALGWRLLYSEAGGAVGSSPSFRRGFYVAVDYPRAGSDRNGKPLNP